MLNSSDVFENKQTVDKRFLILASGGIDSTACIHYYLSRGFGVKALHVDYGQVAYAPESIAVARVCSHFKIEFQTVMMHGISWITNDADEIVGRNLLLAAIAIGAFDAPNGIISMGIHEGIDYVDCMLDFQLQLSNISKLVTNYRIDFDFPFGTWGKADIIRYCRDNDVPISKTFSCVNSNAEPCGQCSSCEERVRYLGE